MTKREHRPLHVVCASVGALCMGVDVVSNVDFMYASTGKLFDSSIAAVVAVALGTAFALTASLAALRQRAIVAAIMLFFGFLLGAGFSLSATLDRVATQRDVALAKVWDNDPELAAMKESLADLRQRKMQECATGDGPKCKALTDAVEIEAVKSAPLIAAREARLDSMGQRIAAMIPALTVEQASMYQPVLLPVALFVLANWLLAFGLSGAPVIPEFDIRLTGRAEQEERAKRYVTQYKGQFNRAPNVVELRRALQVSEGIAKKALKAA